jgi:hypothetical protein
MQNPFKKESLNIISKSTCNIDYIFENQKREGKGFLLILPIPQSNDKMRGLITSNQILNTNNLYNSLITLSFNENQTKLNLIPKEHFCFSDPFLDITFIELKNPEFDGMNFLSVDENANNSSYVYMIQDSKGEKISEGKIKSRWGFKLLHTISVEEDNAGSALISLENNKVFGVIINKQNEDENNNVFSVAVNIKTIIQAIRLLYNSYLHNKTAFEEKENGFIQKEVKFLNDSKISELKEHGLFSSENPLIFISPKSHFITPLWFYRTSYAWYWTPTEPQDDDADYSNWIIIYPGCSLRVIGGEWNGFEPAKRNVILIHWLESTGLKYLV